MYILIHKDYYKCYYLDRKRLKRHNMYGPAYYTRGYKEYWENCGFNIEIDKILCKKTQKINTGATLLKLCLLK